MSDYCEPYCVRVAESTVRCATLLEAVPLELGMQPHPLAIIFLAKLIGFVKLRRNLQK